MSCKKCKVKEYLKETKTIRLATIDKENHLVIRTLGAFAIEAYTVYFLTAKVTEKVKQIENNNNVVVLFEQENQIIPNFINVTVNGIAFSLVWNPISGGELYELDGDHLSEDRK